MASFCPNINSKEWKDHEKLVGPKLSYYMWMVNGGFPLNLAPNGKESKLIKSLMELPEVTSVQQAMVIKSRMLTSKFKEWQEATPTEGFSPEGELLSFLEKYGFDISDAESLSIDLALKEISLDSSDPEQVAKAIAAPLAEMLSYSDYFYEVERDVRKSKRFKSRLKELKKEYPESTRRNLNRIVTKEIFKELLESGFSEQLAKELNINKSFIDKIKEIIQKIAQAFSGTNFKASRDQVSKIVENTFKGDDFIRLTKKEGYKKVDFQEAFDENAIAKDIMTKIGTNENIVLTGSIAYSTQGTVYRKIETVVHDLDFVNQGLSKEEIDDLVKSNYPDAILAYSFTDKYDVDTYLVPPVGIKIENIKRRDTGKITYYELHNSKGEVVGTYELQYEVSSTNKTINETEFKTGEEAMLVDFFTNDKNSREVVDQEFKGSDNKSHTIKLSKFNAPFEAKLRFSRFKDIWDYNRFMPKVLDENGEPVIENGNVINKSGETLPIFSESTIYLASRKKEDKYEQPLIGNIGFERKKEKKGKPITSEEVLRYLREQGIITKRDGAWMVTKGISGFMAGQGLKGDRDINLRKLKPYVDAGILFVTKGYRVFPVEETFVDINNEVEKERKDNSWWNKLSTDQQISENLRREQEGLEQYPVRGDKDYYDFLSLDVGKKGEKLAALERNLLAFARNNGLSVEQVNNVKQELAKRGKLITSNNDVLGVALIMEDLILLAKGEHSTKDLAEEVAHFVVEWMWNDISTQRAIQEIEQTPEYQEVLEHYGSLTTQDSAGNEVSLYDNEMLIKETLGKLISKSLIEDQNVSKPAQVKEPLLKAIISKIIKAFKALLGKNPRAASELSEIINKAKDVIESNRKVDRSNFNRDNLHPFFLSSQKSADEVRLDSIKSHLAKLVRRLEEAMKKAQDPDKAKSIKNYIEQLQDAINDQSFDVGALEFINAAKSEYKDYYNIDDNFPGMVQKFEEGIPISGKTIKNMRSFIAIYTDVLSMITDHYPSNHEMRKEAESLLRDIAALRPSLRRMAEEYNLSELMPLLNTDSKGNLISNSFSAEEVTKGDLGKVNWWYHLFGQAQNAKSEIVKLIQKKLKDLKFSVERHTIDVRNKLVRLEDAAKAAGLNTKDLFEVNENGERTGNIISEYNIDKFYKDRRQVFTDVAKEFGFKSYDEMEMDGITPQIRERIKERISEFTNENTVTKYREVEVRESANKIVIKKEEYRVPVEKYRNPKFKSVIKEGAIKNYYDALIESKLEDLRKTKFGRYGVGEEYKIPQIKGDLLDRLKGKTPGNIIENIKDYINEGFKADEDDTIFGDLNDLDRSARTVPVFFNKKLDNMNNLTWDITGAYIHYSEMAENFKQMNSMSGPLEIFMDSLTDKTITVRDSRGNPTGKEIPVTSTREYRTIKNIIDNLVYGVQIEETTLGDTGKSAGKMAKRTSSYIRFVNLVLNNITMLAGQVKANIDLAIEQKAKIYITGESRRWGRAQLIKEMPSILSQTGKNIIESKAHKAMEMFGGSVSVKDALNKMHRGRLKKTIMDSNFAFLDYRMGSYVITGQMVIGVLDNHRFYEGEFVSFHDFEQKIGDKKKAKKLWKDLRKKSLWNSLDKDMKPTGELAKYVTDDLLARVYHITEHLKNTMEGTVSKEDKGWVARQWWGEIMLVHRGWFITGANNRFKSGGIDPEESANIGGFWRWRKQLAVKNYETGIEELGSYRAMQNFIIKAITDAKYFLLPKFTKSTYNKLSPIEKKGVIKATMDLGFVILTAVAAAMLDAAADDEDEKDNWQLQALAYLGTRIYIEQSSLANPIEAVSLLKQPVVGANHLIGIMELGYTFASLEYNDTIERGPYEGWKKWQKLAAKRLPGKALFEISQDPKSKRTFFKTIPKGPAYSITYNEYAEDE